MSHDIDNSQTHLVLCGQVAAASLGREELQSCIINSSRGCWLSKRGVAYHHSMQKLLNGARAELDKARHSLLFVSEVLEGTVYAPSERKSSDHGLLLCITLRTPPYYYLVHISTIDCSIARLLSTAPSKVAFGGAFLPRAPDAINTPAKALVLYDCRAIRAIMALTQVRDGKRSRNQENLAELESFLPASPPVHQNVPTVDVDLPNEPSTNLVASVDPFSSAGKLVSQSACSLSLHSIAVSALSDVR